MDLFPRVFQHLLPDAKAWRLGFGKQLTKLFEGLAELSLAARVFADGVYEDMFPGTTRQLAEWERHFGIAPAAVDEADRRLDIAAAWRASGGQSPAYIQGVLQAAGFPVYVHEWWEPGSSPRIARNPLNYTNEPLLGTVQCGEDFAQCGESEALANAFLANDPGYLVNLSLTPTSPPPVPNDPNRWPYFLYVCGQTFGSPANIPAARRAEFERLLLKICPAQNWIVAIVSYV